MKTKTKTITTKTITTKTITKTMTRDETDKAPCPSGKGLVLLSLTTKGIDMNVLFNEYGALTHVTSLALSDAIHHMVTKHCQSLIDDGYSPAEIRALSFYFTGDVAISETILSFAMKKRKAKDNSHVQ